jgi:hypothetical protein
MDDTLYDTSWLVHSISRPTDSLAQLFDPTSSTPQSLKEYQIALAEHANSFRDTLTRNRPRYEREEENDTIGDLKTCTWAPYNKDNVSARAGVKRKPIDGDARRGNGDSHLHGVVISLLYEKSTFKFIICAGSSNTSRRPRTGVRSRRTSVSLHEAETPILLAKSSPAALRALTTYLCDKFSLEGIYPLRLHTGSMSRATLLQNSLEEYLATLYRYLVQEGSNRDAIDEPLFKATVGQVRMTISFSEPVAPSLKSLEIAVPPQTSLALFEKIHRHQEEAPELEPPDRASPLMKCLSDILREKTGLSLAVLTRDEPEVMIDEPNRPGKSRPVAISNKTQSDPDADSVGNAPMRITRVSTAAYALSADSRLKFSSKAVEMVDRQGEMNIVRCANQDLLQRILEEAARQVRQDED